MRDNLVRLFIVAIKQEITCFAGFHVSLLLVNELKIVTVNKLLLYKRNKRFWVMLLLETNQPWGSNNNSCTGSQVVSFILQNSQLQLGFYDHAIILFK